MTTEKTVICATPYDPCGNFWYFSSYTEYKTKYKANAPREEYELQFIDGSNFSQLLFDNYLQKICNVERFFELLELYDDEITDNQIVALTYLVDFCTDDFEKLLDRMDDVCVIEGKASDAIYDLVQESYGHIFKEYKQLQLYFDYDAYERDMEINGELYKYDVNNTDYCVIGSY